jgi:flagellin
MGLAINTNVTSMKSQRHLNTNTGALNTSFERLSSGLRINSAKDDAAGMNITTKLTSQVKGLNQAARNVADTASLMKTAESALSETNNLLQRLRVLAVQAGNDTNTAADRQALHAETTQLLAEIDRVANQVQYNGQNLLDGSFSSKTFQVGANAGQTLTVSIDAARSTDIGNSSEFTTVGDGNETDIDLLGTEHQSVGGFVNSAALAGGEFKIGGNGVTVDIGATVAADDVKSSSTNASSAIAKAAAVNRLTAQTGVSAEATATNWKTDGDTAVAGFATFTDGDVIINDVAITVASGTAVVEVNDASGVLVDAINAKTAQTGVTASINATNNNLELEAADGRNVRVELTADGETTVGATNADTTARGGMKFSSNDTANGFTVSVAGTTTDLVSIGLGNTVAADDGATSVSGVATTGNDIAEMKLGTTAFAASALSNLDTAIAQVAESRSALGALLNRLDSASNTLKISSENMSAARSEIQDVDFAQETADFSKHQILQQASSSMLTQANTSGQIALSLLGFG